MDAAIRVSIPDYSIASEKKESVQYYNIHVNYGNNKWVVSRRYKEFFHFQKLLLKTFLDLPKFPEKTYFSITKHTHLEKRRAQLEIFLQGLSLRREIVLNPNFILFLKINENTNNSCHSLVSLLGKYCHLAFGIRNMCYIEKHQILFITCHEMNAARRFGSYVDNLKTPFDKSDTPFVCVGSIDCIKQKSNTLLEFEKLWSKNFPQQAISICYDEKISLLCVGLDDGIIWGGTVTSNSQFTKFEDKFSLQIHKARVMGIYIDGANNLIYSISEDNTAKIVTSDSNQIVFEVCVSAKKLTEMKVDCLNKRLIIADRIGKLHIYAIKLDKITKIHSIQTDSSKSIRGLAIDLPKNICYACSFDDGYLHAIDLQQSGKESNAQKIKSVLTKPKARVVEFSPHRQEIYVGNEDGTIFIFLSNDLERPIYVFSAHSSDICSIVVSDEKNLLITSSKSKSLKFWRLPKAWGCLAGESIHINSSTLQRQESIPEEDKEFNYESTFSKKLGENQQLKNIFSSSSLPVEEEPKYVRKSFDCLREQIKGLEIKQHESDNELDGWEQQNIY